MVVELVFDKLLIRSDSSMEEEVEDRIFRRRTDTRRVRLPQQQVVVEEPTAAAPLCLDMVPVVEEVHTVPVVEQVVVDQLVE